MCRLAGVAIVAALVLGPASHAASTVTVVVDVTAGKHAISPLIYGWNGEASLDQPHANGGGFATTLAASRPGLVRIGGNRFSAFNWETSYSNAGSDYLYENDDYLDSSTTPGHAVLDTVKQVKAVGGSTLVTVPIGDYVAKDDAGPVDVSDAVDTSRFLQNKPTGPYTSKPSTSDAFVYENQFAYWLAHTVSSSNVLWSLDNEPNDWSSTHEEIHPQHLTYSELVTRDLTYAKAIDATYAKLGLAAPLITGPALDGWQGQEDPANNDGSSTDFQTTGRFVDYYLKQLKAADKKAGRRIIGVLDLHWYPQVSPDVYNVDNSAEIVAAREQAPRSLWDDSYTENSWVADYLGGPIELIPRLKAEIAQSDPGLGLGITEWNYGGGSDISGGIATADTLGIFGAQGLKLAAYWPQFQGDQDEDYAFGAFAMYRNFDGNGGAFGNTAVSTTDSDPVSTSAYASVSSSNAKRATIVLVNKNDTPTTVSLQLKHFTSTGHASVYTLRSGSASPQPADAITATGANTFTYEMPAQSVSMIVPVAAKTTPVFYADAPPAAFQGLPYSYTFGATGTPAPTYTRASGTLPAGLTLSKTGVLSGTPTGTGTAAFTVRATNTAGKMTTPQLSVTTSVGDAPQLTGAAPPDGVWESTYSYAFTATGNPSPAFAVTSGALPPGLTLGHDGTLSGAPTSVGTYSFEVTAANGVSPDAATSSLTVHVTGPAAGTVLAWGAASGGQLGNGHRVKNGQPAPVPLPGGATAVQVAAGDEHALALTSDGKVYAWGNDICGEIGDGHDGSCGADRPVRAPTLVVFPDGTAPIVQIAAGSKDSLAIDADGNVWGWGDDGVGELGDGATGVTRDTPVEVSLGSPAVAIAANGYATAALTGDGRVFTWGSGVQGALGSGGTDDSSTPVEVDLGGVVVSAIAAGGSQAGHVIALEGDSLVGWGNNARGQLGDGTTTDRTSPVPVGPADVVSIATGGYQSFAFTNDGKIWAWGNNGYGELGTGASGDHEADPQQAFGGLTSVTQISGGDFFTLALTADGAVHAVGIDDSGQLGDGLTANSATVRTTLLPAGTTVSSISAGAAFGLAIVG